MMSTLLSDLMKQAQALSPGEKIDLALALLEQTRAEVQTGKSNLKWGDIHGSYAYPMFGEEAQSAIDRLRDEWEEREKSWDSPHEP